MKIQFGARLLTNWFPAGERGDDHPAGLRAGGGFQPRHDALGHVAKGNPAIVFFSVRRRNGDGVFVDAGQSPSHQRNSATHDIVSIARDVAPVLGIDGKYRTVNITGTTRAAAAALVDREAQRTSSRMVAYENVAATVGTTAGWLRKFVNNYPDVSPNLVVGFNILAYYASITSPRN